MQVQGAVFLRGDENSDGTGSAHSESIGISGIERESRSRIRAGIAVRIWGG
ncbi:MAG: hypothetical protein QW328_07745 [Nitrososphaerota archaeon]